MNTLNLERMLRVAVLPLAAAATAALVSVPSRAADNAAANKAATTSATTSATSQGMQNQASTTYRAMRASRLIGMEVRNPQGRNIGEIRDLVVNVDTGEIRYSMLAFDPGILQGERLFAVPTTELRMGTDNQIVYNMTRDKLERAAVSDADWNARWRDTLPNADRVWNTGGVTQPSQAARSYRVSDLLNKDVHSRSGEDIGELKELVVNMATQKAHYAVLAFDPSWTTPERNYAFPLTAFQLAQDRDELVLDVDRSQVQSMKGFNDQRYSSLNDRNWVVDVDRYLVTLVPTNGSTAGSNANSTGNTAANSGRTDLFTRLDADRNGWLERTEVSGNADINQAWSRWDANQDGRVSREEFTSPQAMGATGAGNRTAAMKGGE